MEGRRHFGAEHPAGLCFRAAWLPDERLLLRPNLRFAVGDPFSSRSRDLPQGLHPTQIYESALSLVLYLGLAWLYRRKKFDGQVFATYLVCYAMMRSIVEVFRGDYRQYYLGGWVTPAQLVSIGILVTGVVLLFVLKQHMQQRA